MPEELKELQENIYRLCTERTSSIRTEIAGLREDIHELRDELRGNGIGLQAKVEISRTQIRWLWALVFANLASTIGAFWKLFAN